MRPLIAVVGSADPGRTYHPALADMEIAPRACEEIGTALADAGCDLVVYSSEAQFVEDRVVSGYLSHGDVAPGSIQVRPPYGAGEKDFPMLEERPEVFDVRYESGDDWESSFYRSLREVHGVVLIGGGRSTLITGMVCLAFGIPVYAVACFGGASRRVWDIMNRVTHHAARHEVSTMGAEWGPGAAHRLVQLLRTQQERKDEQQLQETRSRRKAAWRSAFGITVGLLLLCLGLGMIPLTYAVDASASINLTGLIVGALATGTSGAITRNAFDRGEHWARTAALGMSAGAVAFLLFVSAQLAASPEILSGEGARRLLFFVLTVGFVSGFTFDAVYGRLKQAEPPIPPPSMPTSTPPSAANGG
ncbi:hypothetical protein SUDANB21_06805 (plasmid) [Streptomyces sp. enrichment culture]|uniref:hypothetical protein n=1 Tax=Streptomyces sp. enrichment culture TaxID=1795815 RepID=UPI0034732FCE